jgi:hypothetical protein
VDPQVPTVLVVEKGGKIHAREIANAMAIHLWRKQTAKRRVGVGMIQ